MQLREKKENINIRMAIRQYLFATEQPRIFIAVRWLSTNRFGSLGRPVNMFFNVHNMIVFFYKKKIKQHKIILFKYSQGLYHLKY